MMLSVFFLGEGGGAQTESVTSGGDVFFFLFEAQTEGKILCSVRKCVYACVVVLVSVTERRSSSRESQED